MSSQPAGLNCTKGPWMLQPNSDISGKGILTGFAATAYSTLLLCIAYYLVGHKPFSNPVDRRCIDGFYQFFNQSRPTEKWAKALEAAVLTFSDQQIITGIALLISGYSQLRGGLAVYYWQLTVDLAWFSSITHLTTLTCLRYYLQERHGLKLVRLIFMAVTMGMLSCALASTGFLGNADYSYDYPAWCLFHESLLRPTYLDHNEGSGLPDEDLGLTVHGNGWSPYYNTDFVVLALLFLCVSYGARVIQLFPSGLDKILRNGCARLNTFTQRRLLKYKTRALDSLSLTYWASVYIVTFTVYCIFKAAADLYSSMLWEITWLAMALAWGTLRIITDRASNSNALSPDPISDFPYDVTNAISEDDVWGFGQVVAVVLLLAPLFSFFETIYESVILDKKSHGRSPTSASTTFISPDPVASPGFSDPEPWTNLYECAWFRSLVWLIYLLSLATAANVLVLFPWADGYDDLKENIGFFIRSYLAWLGFDLAVLLFFTITSLSICHAQDTLDFRWTWRAKKRPKWGPSKRAKLIQRTLLIVSVSILTASSTVFGFRFLLNPSRVGSPMPIPNDGVPAD